MAGPGRSAELEAAIIADPDDAAPYLVYADWLQQRGDPRGELIVVQHALETARGAIWARLKIREHELLTDHGAQLLGPVAAPHHWHHFDWRRGFVDRMRGDFLLDEGEQLIAHPSLALVRAVSDVELPRIHEVAPPLLDELAVEAQLPRTVLAQTRVRHLTLAGSGAPFDAPAYRDADLETAALETLAFRGDHDRLRELSAYQFPSLRVLRTSCGDHGEDLDAVLALLTATPHGELDLRLRAASDTAGLAALGDVTARRRIRALRLDDPDLATLRRLRSQLRRLERLELGGSRDRAVDIVAALPIAPRLRHLVLDHELVDPDAAAALATSPCAATIETLTLRLGGRRAMSGLTRGGFAALRVLDLTWCGLATADAAVLSEVFPHLDELIVDWFELRAIADSPLASSLPTLTLRATGGTNPERGFMREIEKFRALRRLRLITGKPALSPTAFATLGALAVAVELAPNVPTFADML